MTTTTTTTEKNECAKTRPIDNPYETWVGHAGSLGKMEFRVLKKYQKPSLEAKNEYARWFVAAKSDATFGSWELGDTYVSEIKSFCRKIS